MTFFVQPGNSLIKGTPNDYLAEPISVAYDSAKTVVYPAKTKLVSFL